MFYSDPRGPIDFPIPSLQYIYTALLLEVTKIQSEVGLWDTVVLLPLYNKHAEITPVGTHLMQAHLVKLVILLFNTSTKYFVIIHRTNSVF